MTSRIGVAVMGAGLLIYLLVAIWLSVMFIIAGTPASIGMGIALILLAPIGAWALIRELMFGFAADKLGRALDAEGGMPAAPDQLMPSGRLLPADADRLVTEYSTSADEQPADWRARYRLGVVQDAAGRRKDARSSIREAIRLSRAQTS